MQGKGIGSALVRSGLETAEKLNLDVFVLAFEGGLRLYKALGFRILKEVIRNDDTFGNDKKYSNAFLLWESPHKKSGTESVDSIT